MRIVGGRLRGARLAPVGAGNEAARLRPTSDRVRESLFNLLAHGPYGDPPQPEGRRVLDLFAGTGALGLEALSRGASEATFVDNLLTANKIIRTNIATLRLGAKARSLSLDATRLGPAPVPPHDLVFLDPPYGRSLGEAAVSEALAGGWIAPGALILWEESAAPQPPPGLIPLDSRRYGETMIAIFRAA